MAKINTYYPANNIILNLLVLSILVLGEGAFGKTATLAAILLSLAGLITSGRITDSKINHSINIAIDIANIAVCIWIVILIMQSSFIYEKIIFSLGKGIIFIIAILSFNPTYRRNSTYIQILTLLLFIMYPLFLRTNTLSYKLLAVIYIIIWITFIRISLRKRRYENYREISRVFISCILVTITILPLVYMLKNRIYFPKIKQFSSFLRTEKLNIDDQLYELQDKLYKESKELVEKYNPHANGNQQAISLVNKKKEAQGRIVNLLSALFQESPYTLKVEKARSGLKDIFHKPGFGLKEGDKKALISTLERYINTKIRVNNSRKTSELSNEIRSSVKNLKAKLSALLAINKINYSNNIEEVNHELDSLNKIADYFSNDKNKDNIKKTIDELKRWKLYSIYNESRNKIEDTIKNINKTAYKNNHQNKKYISNLLNTAENTMTPLGISRLTPETDNLHTALKGASKEIRKNIGNSFKRMLKSKIELSLDENLDKLIDKLTKDSISQQTIDKISKQMRNIINSESANALLKETETLKSVLEETETSKYVLNDIHTQNIIIGKTEILKNKEETEINKLLDKSMLSEKKKRQLINYANSLFYSKYSTINDWNNLKNKIKNLSSSGEIYKDAYEELENRLSQLHIISRVRKYSMKQRQKMAAKNKGIWDELMENVHDDNIRNNLSSMMDELKSATHIQEISMTKENLYTTLDELKKGRHKDIHVPRKYQTRVSVLEGIVSVAPYDENGPRYKEEVILKAGESITVEGNARMMQERESLISRVKDYVKTVSQMRKKTLLTEETVKLMKNLENLQKANKDYENKISPLLRKLQEIYAKGGNIDKKLIKEMKDLYFELSINRPSEKQPYNKPKGWEIFAFPKKVLLNKESTEKTEVLGVYNNIILKDITQEVVWKFDNPSIAWIDKEGVIHPISTGTTKAFTTYKGSAPLYIDITVVKPFDGTGAKCTSP